MTPAGRLRLAVIAGTCLPLLMLADGRAQPPPVAPSAPVSPLVVLPERSPAPDIGEGEAQYTIADLEALATKARRDKQEARGSVRDCDSRRTGRNVGPPQTIPDLLALLYAREVEFASQVETLAPTAITMTEEENLIRARVPRGQATTADLAAIELKRQAAVNALNTARNRLEQAKLYTAKAQELIRLNRDTHQGRSLYDFVEGQLLIYRPPDYIDGFRVLEIPKAYADLGIENVAARDREDGKGRFLLITGQVRNTRKKSVSIPPLAIAVVDSHGFPVRTEVADPRGASRIEPGQAKPFAYVLRPKPTQAQRVAVTFASREKDPWRMPSSLYCSRMPGGGILAR